VRSSPAAALLFRRSACASPSVNNQLRKCPTETKEQFAKTAVHIRKNIADRHLIGSDRPRLAVEVINEEQRVWAFEAGINNFGQDQFEVGAFRKRHLLACGFF
jgi:hypothetical protein